MDLTVLEYNRAHAAVRRKYGRADTYQCLDCDEPARDWCHEHNTDPLNPDNYWPRCRKCHKKYDYVPWDTNRVHGNKGMLHTVETCARMSASMKGRKANNKKVDEELLTEIIAMHKRGENFSDIAYELGLHRTTVSWYVRHKI
jgi:hypothetical protein